MADPLDSKLHPAALARSLRAGNGRGVRDDAAAGIMDRIPDRLGVQVLPRLAVSAADRRRLDERVHAPTRRGTRTRTRANAAACVSTAIRYPGCPASDPIRSCDAGSVTGGLRGPTVTASPYRR